MKIQNQLDETKIILHDTMKEVLRRGENLEDLVTKSEVTPYWALKDVLKTYQEN